MNQASSPEAISSQQSQQDCKREDVHQKYLDYKHMFAGKPTNWQRSSVHIAARIGARLLSSQRNL